MSGDGPGPGPVPSSRTLLRGLAVWLVAVCVATLTPVRDGAPLPEGVCLVCGENGTADALRNVLLFVPLGLLMAGFPGGPRWRAPLIALAVSAALEGLQILIPGRHPSVGDLAFNGAGALAGVFAMRLMILTAWGPAGTRRLVGAGAAALAGAAVLMTALLAEPARIQGRLHVRLRPEFGHLAMLPGRVESARVGAQAFRDIILPPGADLARQVREGTPLEVAFIVTGALETGRDTGLLRAHDDPGHEVLFLGLRAHRLVFRERILAGVLRLEVPTHTLPLTSPPTPGETLTARVERRGDGLCLDMEAPEPTSACGVGLTPGAGWRYVGDVPGAPAPVRAAIQLLWLGALMVPFGLSNPSRTARVVALVGVWGAMLLAAASGPLLPPTVGELLAVPAGLVLGLVLRPAVPRRNR